MSELLDEIIFFDKTEGLADKPWEDIFGIYFYDLPPFRSAMYRLNEAS